MSKSGPQLRHLILHIVQESSILLKIYPVLQLGPIHVWSGLQDIQPLGQISIQLLPGPLQVAHWVLSHANINIILYV